MRIGKTKIKVPTYYNREKKGLGDRVMKRKLIIDGNAVYEIDEECMIKKRLDENREKEEHIRHGDKNQQNQQRQ